MKLFARITGSGKPLIILHGLFGMSDNWISLSAKFATHGFKVFAIDIRNHGQSLHSSIFNYDAMVLDVVEFIKDNNLQNVSMIGHSMGGKVVMLLACLNEKIVKKIIVADIAPRYYAPHHKEVLRAIDAVKLDECKTRSDADRMMLPFENNTAVRQFLLKNLFWKDDESGNKKLCWRFNLKDIKLNIDNVGDALPLVAQFIKPTLFIKGENSNYITDNDAAGINTHFPNSKIISIANAGHWLHAEQPDLFLKYCWEFLIE